MKLLRIISIGVFAMTGLVAFATAQGAKWIEGRSPHFLLWTDTPEAKARRLLEDFEGRVAAISDMLGPVPARQFPIEIFLFNKVQDFTEVTGVEPQKSAYLFRGPDRVFVVARDKSPEDLADDAGHALGHVFFERTTLWRPFWLAEGSAEYFRRAGRKPDTKGVAREESFTVRELLRIVPSVGYRDSDPGGASRTQSYRLLRLIEESHGNTLRRFLEINRTEDGDKARIDIDNTAALAGEFESFKETPPPLTPRRADIHITPADADVLTLRRGDLLLAAGKTSAAGERYVGSSPEARAARAILIRFTRNPVEAARALERTARELPSMGLVQLHFGSLDITTPPDLIASQAQSLERAVTAFPLSGRAAGELARVYALDGRAERALPLIEKALTLEPEYGDRFYDIRSQAFAALRRFDEAYRTMKISAALPHSGEKVDALYEQKVKAMSERVENYKRDADSQRVDQLRKEIDRAAALVEPTPPPPPPPAPTRQPGMEYQIDADTEITVVNRVYPVFPASLIQKGSGGEIAFAVTIDQEGRVTNIEVLRSQLPELNASTTSSLRRWTFKPVEVDGQAVSTRMTLTFRYEVQEVDALPALR